MLEAKKASVNPISAQDQGRHYADLLGVPFVFLSNGDEVWFLDTDTRIRELLAARAPAPDTDGTNTLDGPRVLALPCPCCGGRLIIVEAFGPGGPPQHRSIPEAIDSS